ncbi:SDR family oxidoreductase [Sphingomonas populi]|uniref:SDR family oxidoreductase n=1 Tax=Sphingomonas populi TaxID=2484750 RepID=A0A4Q6Y2H1_9SPHN|nr:SDR family oxidoreductase [Sphingomonas populi]
MIEGRTALVTGGTRGLGLALARALVEAGASVALVGRDAETARAAAAALGPRTLGLAADVTDAAGLEAAAAATRDAFGAIDILVCAAGIGAPRAPVWESDPDAFRACYDTNVLGVLLAMKAVMPAMIAARTGRVVVIGGTYGHKGVAGFGLYGSSKWALRGIVKSAALDAAPYRVSVNMISPGGVDGERLQRLFRESAARNGEPADAPLTRFTASTALRRLVGEDDIAATLRHLLGPGGRMITGQDIIVDSGTIL